MRECEDIGVEVVDSETSPLLEEDARRAGDSLCIRILRLFVPHRHLLSEGGFPLLDRSIDRLEHLDEPRLAVEICPIACRIL